MASDEDLADELRALARQLHATHADDGRRDAAYSLLRDAREQLSVGERRLRWYETTPESHGKPARNRELSSWSGVVNAIAPPMRLEVGERDGEPAMVGHVRLTRLREGPPGCVHGGVVAGLFDEIMGAAQRLGSEHAGLTGRLTIRYRALTPLDTDLVFRAWLADQRPTRMIIRAELVLAHTVGTGEQVTATAEAFFVRPRR